MTTAGEPVPEQSMCIWITFMLPFRRCEIPKREGQKKGEANRRSYSGKRRGILIE
jgi:hypothetical protein